MRRKWTDDEILEIRNLTKGGMQYKDIATKLGSSTGSIASIIYRTKNPEDTRVKPEGSYKGNNARTIKKPSTSNILVEGSMGVLARTSSDKSRITLKHIPSIAEFEADTEYSYISRDRKTGK